MSDDWLKMLLESMQREIAELRGRVDVLEMALAEAMDGEPDPDAPSVYMDGTPVNH